MFKVGDYVVVSFKYHHTDGMKGVVVVCAEDDWVGIDFGPGYAGNHLGGVLATPTGYFLQPKCLKFDRRGTLKRYLCLK